MQNFKVEDFCTEIKCNEGVWINSFDVCLCAHNESLTKEIKGIDEKDLCCKSTFFRKNIASSKIECPFDNQQLPGDDMGMRSFNVNGKEIKIDWLGKEEKRDVFCYGRSWAKNEADYLRNPLKNYAILAAKKPCDGSSSCLRYCEKNDDTQNQIRTRFHYIQEWAEAPPSERKCPETQLRVPKEFNSLTHEIVAMNGVLTLKDECGVVIAKENEFCLTVEKEELLVEYCQEQVKDTFKFNVYPYFLLISSIFLALTLVAFFVDKDLIAHKRTRQPLNYNLLKRHYVGTLLIGMSVMTATQLNNPFQKPTLCIMTAYCHVFFFLSSFSILCQLSLELVLTVQALRVMNEFMKGRYVVQLLAGYGIPGLICILALITDTHASRCCWIRPGFGDKSCFFKSKWSTGFWFYLPIGISLIFNAGCLIKFYILR